MRAFDRRTLLLGALVSLSGCALRPMTPSRTVLVAGATGQTGRLVVQDLIDGGYLVRALVRNTEEARRALGPEPELHRGDVRDPATILPAMHGVHAVVCAIGARSATGPERPEAVYYQGVSHLVEAAAHERVRHFVLISSRGVTHDDPEARFGDVLRWKRRGEEVLRASGLHYTIIRPGRLVNARERGRLVLEQGDAAMGGPVPRRALSRVIVQSLHYPEARDRTFELRMVPGWRDRDWQAQFSALEPDPGR